ncbi:MAG TPA: hypothetical protein VIW69_06460, partial [Candidatus Elarobacter sp.]
MQNVIAFIEHKHGTIRRSSLEAATQARTLADALGGKAHAVVAGDGAQQAAETLKKYPLDQIHVSNEDGFIDGAVDALESVAKAAGPSL